MLNFSFLDLLFEMFIIALGALVLARQNFISMLIALELLLLTINLSFVYWSLLFLDFLGFLMFIIILTIAAVESVLGLALAVSFFKIQHSVLLVDFFFLKG